MADIRLFGYGEICDCGNGDDLQTDKPDIDPRYTRYAPPPNAPDFVTNTDWAGKVLSVFEDLDQRLRVVEEKLARVNQTSLRTTPKVLWNGRNRPRLVCWV